MIRSVQVRFFLVVWPLVVLALAGVGWAFGRWTRVEIRREAYVSKETTEAPMLHAQELSSLLLGAPDWQTVEDRLRDSDPGRDPTVAIVLADRDGRVLALSDPALSDLEIAMHPDGSATAVRRAGSVGSEQEVRMRASGTELTVPPALAAEVRPPLRAYLFPGADRLDREVRQAMEDVDAEVQRQLAERGASFVAAADRTIGVSVLIASLVAALATLWLGRLVTGPAQELAGAARRIRSGDLSTRVTRVSQDELGDVAVAFNDMAAELERTEAFKRRMISDAAHELRTPLTNVLGTIQAMQDGLAAPDATQLAALHREASLLHGLVEDLQEIAVADAGGLRLVPQIVDLHALAEQAADVFQAAADRAGVHLEVVGSGRAWADPERTGQILRNLLQNALAHAPEGSRIQVQAAEGTLVVQDEGPGIDAEHLAYVWERFYRVEGARSRASGGTGLGLAIVKRLAEAQGGAASVTSTPGAGARFQVTLPAKPS